MRNVFLLVAALSLFSCSDEFRNRVMIQHIDRLFDEGKYEKAKVSVDSLLNKNPDHKLGWTLKGHIEEKLDNDSVAEVAYTKALSIDPKLEQALTGMGIILRKRKEYDRAAGYYAKAIAVNPEYAQAYSSLVTIELKRKNFSNAVSLGEKAYVLDSTDPVIAANLSIAYHYFGDIENRDKYYSIAKKLKYKNLDVLLMIFKGKATIFDE
jgi:tetratricopeptide (TPR) repeat protein